MDQFTTSELLQAQSHAWSLVYSYFKSMSLKAAIDLGIAEILHKHGKPMSLAQLTTSLSIPDSKSDHFRRLMRALVHQGIFSTDQETQSSYSLTPTSHLILPGNSTSITQLLLVILDPTLSHSAYVLPSWLKSSEETTKTPFAVLHGHEIFELADEKPEFTKLYNEGMASDAGLVMDVVMRSCRDVFEGVESLVDVGGGNGTTAMALKKAFPEMKCTVFDLQHVIQGKMELDGVRFVTGDFFQSVPPASAALLKSILHGWSDEDCVKILKHCKAAISNKDNGGKIIIIDMVIGAVTDNEVSAVETQLFSDLLMLIAAKGKERNEREWRDIIFAAGFTNYKITPLIGLRSVIEVYP
ncbi:O-methyltransferase COMT-type protein [Dioscorea alata]|uniref:O-methyltransferase COMT-type protein n=1 Tax=Dioscorea alata TaxID=55571 RepID=A0ACB7WTY9_DIOAL|nr:O-methyltransferase COMT-type protein [Dioscorea alata]